MTIVMWLWLIALMTVTVYLLDLIRRFAVDGPRYGTWKENSADASAAVLADDLGSATQFLCFVTCMASPSTYGDARVLAAFDGARKRGVQVRGLVRSDRLYKDATGVNPLKELASRGVVQLRGVGGHVSPHWRVTDEVVWIEEPHGKEERGRRYLRHERAYPVMASYLERFDELWGQAEEIDWQKMSYEPKESEGSET